MSSVLTVLICSSALAAVIWTSGAVGSPPPARSAVTMTYSDCRLEPMPCASAGTLAETRRTEMSALRRDEEDMGSFRNEERVRLRDGSGLRPGRVGRGGFAGKAGRDGCGQARIDNGGKTMESRQGEIGRVRCCGQWRCGGEGALLMRGLRGRL